MTEKQVKALRTACEALQYCLDNDIDQDKSRDALDIIAEIIAKYQLSSRVKNKKGN